MQRTFQGAFHSLSGNLIFFPLRKFLKDQTNGNPKLQWLVNMLDESEVPSQTVTVFGMSSKKHVVLSYPDGRLCDFVD